MASDTASFDKLAPMATYELTERTAWKNWVTPKAARGQAVHRWYLFPHSFTSDLVHALIGEWDLDHRDRILDPFVGSGTTLLSAKELGIPSDGYDLSPLAVMASNTKGATYDRERLEASWKKLRLAISAGDPCSLNRSYPELVHRALPDGRLEKLDAISACIDRDADSDSERDFFRLALIAIIPRFSQAIANGGWLRWLNQGAKAARVPYLFERQVDTMLSDICPAGSQSTWHCKAQVADARAMPAPAATYSAVITSPPYPNRHDYTRIFGVELLFAFHDWETNRSLRYQTFHSHPEARPTRPAAGAYRPPAALERVIRNVGDKRIQKMLQGYFLDMYLCLGEVSRVCRKDAKAAFVVGNAQYDGKPVLVDELSAEIGEQVGLTCKEIRAIRWRGNSAQQMGRYGRAAARESVVIFEKLGQPDDDRCSDQDYPVSDPIFSVCPELNANGPRLSATDPRA